MRSYDAWQRTVIAACVYLPTCVTVLAQTPRTESPRPIPPGNDMTMQEYQSLSCGIGGLAGGIAVYVYNEEIATALTGDVNPILLLPLIAAGFSTACGMASSLAPGVAWLYRHATEPYRQQTASE